MKLERRAVNCCRWHSAGSHSSLHFRSSEAALCEITGLPQFRRAGEPAGPLSVVCVLPWSMERPPSSAGVCPLLLHVARETSTARSPGEGGNMPRPGGADGLPIPPRGPDPGDLPSSARTGWGGGARANMNAQVGLTASIGENVRQLCHPGTVAGGPGMATSRTPGPFPYTVRRAAVRPLCSAPSILVIEPLHLDARVGNGTTTRS